MQTLVKTVLALVFSLSMNAQTTAPEPPRTPSTYSDSYSSSISISHTDEDYKIKARFDKARFNDIKTYLLDKLGDDGLSIKGTTLIWSHGSDAFECKLTNTNLKLSLDFERTNENFSKHIKTVGKHLKYVISGGNPEDEMKRAQEEIARAEAEVARAKEELERAKKELAQKKN